MKAGDMSRIAHPEQRRSQTVFNTGFQDRCAVQCLTTSVAPRAQKKFGHSTARTLGAKVQPGDFRKPGKAEFGIRLF